MGMFQQICKRTLVMAMLAGVASIASAADEAGISRQSSLVEWNFANGDDGGWRFGWSKTGDATISPEMDVLSGLGLQLTFDFHGSEWGDSNIKTPWNLGQAPGAVSLRILAPVSGGKPRGPMQLGCAMNNPSWIEAGQWIDLKFPEVVTISGVEYRMQSVTCELGTSLAAPVSRELVLRFGGNAARYKGVLYIQQIRALRIPGAPTVGTPVRSTPVVNTVVNTPAVSTPVKSMPAVSTTAVNTQAVSAPTRTAPAVNTPVVSAPVRTAAPVSNSPRKKSTSRKSSGNNTPVSSTPVSITPVSITSVSNTSVSTVPDSKPKPVIVEQVRAQRNVD